MNTAIPLRVSDIKGLSRLTIDGVVGMTDLVEHMHHTIVRIPVLTGTRGIGRTRGITGLVYRSVRGVTGLVGGSMDRVFDELAPWVGRAPTTPGREQLIAILNGVLGDHLAATGNPLAVPMRVCHEGLSVGEGEPREVLRGAGSKVLVSLHGLCMNPASWASARNGHPGLPARLARRFDYTLLDVHYNSGCHISENGEALADRLERLLADWPVEVEEIVMVGHSMGGLVARSAAHYALAAGHRWPQKLHRMVFLGTPHHGAPLERAGNLVDRVLGFNAYSRPFARLGRIRSAGITDLRYGAILHADWQGRDRFAAAADERGRAQLPDHTECFAVAASGSAPDSQATQGDGLVPVASALGDHDDSDLALAIPTSNRLVVDRIRHIGLLRNERVDETVHDWLA